jgi:hypothetical protein
MEALEHRASQGILEVVFLDLAVRVYQDFQDREHRALADFQVAE